MRRSGFVTAGQKQKELPGMPKRDALGEKAIEYLNEKAALEIQKGIVDRKKIELVSLFVKENKNMLTIDQRVVSISPKDGYKITVSHV